MKIVITGAGGMLGIDLVRVLAPKHEIFSLSHERLDVTDVKKTQQAIMGQSPDLVIHAAAYTDVDGCEKDPDRAYAVNVIGTQNVALACQRARAALVYISTDYVFDGLKGEPYIEWDQPKPVNVYGTTKYAGERVVEHLLDRFYIVRLAWLYGEHGKSFVQKIIEASEGREQLEVVSDQVGSPTYTLDAAQGIARLMETENYGLYHMVNKGTCSWCDFAKRIVAIWGGAGVKVVPVTSEQVNRPAKRPAYSALRNFAIEMTIGDTMRPWEEALTDFLTRDS